MGMSNKVRDELQAELGNLVPFYDADFLNEGSNSLEPL